MMKKILSLMILVLAFSAVAFAQEMDHAKPSDSDKEVKFDASGVIKRGAALSDKTERVALAKILKTPEKYSGKTVQVEGVIVRSCKMEGCWMELAPNKDGKSVRISMREHSFFIPLQSAGLKAIVEGTFSVKTLSKEHVDHLINEDGAKFDKRNADGSVTEVAFEATGVELRKGSE